MPLKSVDAPEPLHPPFEGAEQIVEAAFSTLARTPEQGVIRIADERFVLMRCESLYLAWFDALAESFGDETARQFVYNTAREIGRSDSEALAQRQGLSDPVAKLACGPVQFAHAGWARVVILEDSAPANDESYFLHYVHPNTFESEVLRNKGRRVDRCACLFSAGYSAGWCSAAFGVEVHGKEVRCVAAGASRCEFVMSPAGSLEAHAARVLNRQSPHALLMKEGFNPPPPHVVLSPVAKEVFAVLARHTAFPWPALMAQCHRIEVSPGELRRSHLPTLIPYLARAVGRFTSPETEAEVSRELQRLLG